MEEEGRRFTCFLSRHELGLDSVEFRNESEIRLLPIQYLTESIPLLTVLIQAEDFHKFALDIIGPKNGHLLWSKLVVGIGERKLVVPGEEASRVCGVVSHRLWSLEDVKAIRAAQLHLDYAHLIFEFVVHVGSKLE